MMSEHEQCACQGGDMFDMSAWPKEMKKEFKMAVLKKKEKMLEAKLEFIREIMAMMKKSSESKE